MKKLKRTVKRGLSLSLALVMCIGMLQITALAESETIENEDGTTTVIDITEDIWENGSSKTETSVTTDADGNVLSESTTETTTETTTDEEGKTLTEDTTVSGSETSTENQGPTESTEEITGGASGEITVTPGGSGSIESNVSEALKPDTSGEEWTENDDGSHSKVEDVENGTSTTTVTTSKDDAGNDVYTTETVTTTTVTETIPFEAPEEGTTENEDGSRTTITVERDENGNVTGYVEVTEVRNAEGVVTSSVTKTVNHFGQATTTTKTTNTKTQVVAPDATSKIEVSVGEVTAGDGHGVLNTHGPDVDLGDFTPVDVDDLPDDAMVYVSGVGLRSKYEIRTILSTSAGALGGQTSSVYATQYAVTDKNGNVHVVYCADLSTPIDTIMEYYLTNTEDADYWTNNGRPIGDVNGGSHIRDIVSNGYWGTSEGTGSLDKMIQDLLDAKADGNEWLQSLTDDQIKGLDADLALAATQAAIWKYGNNGGQSSVWWSSVQYPVGDGGTWQWNPDTLTLTKETTVWDPEKGCNVIKTETKKFTIPSGLDAETMFKLETKPDGSQILTVPTFAQRYVHLVPDNWLNGDTNNLGLIVGSDAGNKYSDKNQLAIAIFNYLTNLEQQKDTTTDLIQPSDIVEAVTNVKNTIRDEESDETKYEADVSFVLTVQPDRLNGDLLVHVYDAETGLILATRRVAGEGEEQMAGATQTENGMKYTIDGLVLANGQQVRINLVGSQAVEKGAYLITAKDGTGASQTFVGLEEGERGVDLNFTLQLDVTGAEVKTTESSKIEQNRTWTEETGVRYNYYTLDIDPGPGPGPDPTPTPTPDPDPDPDPDPSVEIPDPDVPLAEIPEEPVPTVEDPEIEIPEEDVPLADVPQTGDISLMWYAMTALAAAGLMILSALGRKSRK